ncbi:hypothetical protein ACJMK2_026550 [Sinanodonta woodiana]|uniref:Uncharacterized protein n=1 Tax=Sinanodonta woodiana TaxID=1069815 RepID=A0ABD3XKC0_SINWO
MDGQNGSISINRNYTGRIESVVHNNTHFSFLLLNVMFNDSGNYTIQENANVKRITSVLVTRRKYVAHIWEPMLLSFKVYEKSMSFIKVDILKFKRSQPVVIYNLINASCTYRDVVSVENCVLINREFVFVIPEIGWLHKGSYFAWDDKDRLLDSIFLDIQGKTTTGLRSSLNIVKESWFIISALGISILVTSLVVVALWKLRGRREMTKRDNCTSRNGIQAINHHSNNAFIQEEIRRVLTKKYSDDLTELMTNRLQPRFKLNDQNMCVRGIGCAMSSINPRCSLQIDSSLSSAETIKSDSTHSTHRYDYAHDIDNLVSECQSKQHYIRSKLLDTNSISGKSLTSFDYNDVVQNIFMPLRPPAPEPVLKKKQNQTTIVANSLYSHKQVNKRWIRSTEPSILFAKKSNQGTIESRRTRSRENLSLKCTNGLSSPSFVHIEKDFAKKDVDSPIKDKKEKWLESKVVKCLPEPYQFRDSKRIGASQCSRDDYPGDDYNQAYAMEKKNRRSWSNDALYGNQICNTKASRSRRFSDSMCIDKDYYDYCNT